MSRSVRPTIVTAATLALCARLALERTPSAPTVPIAHHPPAAIAQANAAAQSAGHLEIVGQLRGNWDAFVADGTHLYAAARNRIQVIDGADPARPRPIGWVNLAWTAQVNALAVAGETVFTAGRASGVWAIDVTDPGRPRTWSIFQGNAFGAAADGDFLFFLESRDGTFLHAVDVREPRAPRPLARLVLPELDIEEFDNSPGAVRVSGGIAAALTSNALYIVDVTDPANPRHLGVVEVADVAGFVLWRGSVFLLEDEDRLLRVLDAADPAGPRWVADLPLTGRESGLARVGNRLYAGGDDLAVIDVTDPRAPRLAHRVVMPERTNVTTSWGENVLAMDDGAGGLNIIRPPDAERAMRIATIEGPGTIAGMDVAGRRAYIADADLLVVDVSDPASPSPLGRFRTPGQGRDVAVAGRYAYVADGYRGLRVVDVADPAAMSEVGALDGIDYASGVAVQGGYAFVANGERGLTIADVADPAAPRRVATMGVAGYAEAVAFAGGYAYLQSRARSFGTPHNGWHAIDVGNPRAPRTIWSLVAKGDAAPPVIAGGRLYLMDAPGDEGDGSLMVFDLAGDGPPVQLGAFTIRSSDSHFVGVAEGFALVATSPAAWMGHGLRAIDVADPARPRLVTNELAVRWAGDDRPGAWYLALASWNVSSSAVGGTLYVTAADTLTIARLVGMAAPTPTPGAGRW